MDRSELERLDRERLVARAQAAGIKRARLLTRPELIDELLRLDPVIDESQLKRSRGFFGVARDLLSRVVERGLHLPDAADRLRAALGSPLPQVPRPEPQAVPTVTLAEIYAAQGHKARAVETLRRVLEAEPEHVGARALLEQLEASDYVSPPPPELPPEVEAPPLPAEDEEDEELPTVELALAETEAAPAPREAREAEAREAEAREAEAREAEAPESSEAPTVEPKTTVFVAPDARPSVCYAVASPSGFRIWWRLAPAALAEAEGGAFAVRAVVIFPTWEGPRVETRDVRVDAASGETVLHGLSSRAVVRVAVGILTAAEPHGFRPLAHSPAIERGPGGLLEWALEGARPMTFDDARLGERVARAVAASV